ncbi:DNA topoisomerase IV subunit B [[Mycoplasma] mobile]|uniref:DNA topoisomerase (ATP-hydrolyzing) n=1 Tax=Mycoplasma mobile (strain ATCC 43663 / 163K / NCTC 11711) TaxID=267748 RepID=Q6KHQ6_MYCM1|nr:DNA topoisomerase IV subunit B [[Mycoplasma] mobile]AAT27872.1 topoisomerase IB subunit B [Mycoplasma mobile 163K]
MNINYDSKSIKSYKDLEAVKKRPGMYIGSTDAKGLHHLVWEIVDNSIDEAIANFANKIQVTLTKDGSVIVEDNGRGIPVDKFSDQKTTVEAVFTELHTGGKFGDGAYKTSGGLHGVGSSVVNALSIKLIATVYRDKKIYETIFENGGEISQSTKIIGSTTKRGTKIEFWPDYIIFKRAKLSYEIISERLRESSFLIQNLEIVLVDENTNQKETFKYENGIVEFVDFINSGKDAINSKTIYINDTKKDINVEIAIQYTDSYNETIVSFVNNIKTRDGGSHENGVKTALTKVFNEYVKDKNLLKGKNNSFEGNDIREGITIVISLRIPENILEFVGQTKDKLGTQEAKSITEDILSNSLWIWLNENKEDALKIINKIKKSQDSRIAAKNARKESRETKNSLKEQKILSGKLSPARSKKASEKELFLVEGDSAGGSAKLGRNSQFQAILPLKGKVINCEKTKLIDVLKNEEISTIINTIGAGIGADFDLKKANYHKVVIMTDADVDGSHIQVLLLTFLYRYMKPLIEAGMVYIALPPLFKITNKKTKKFKYVLDEDELNNLMKKENDFEIQRYKGLGEMNPDQLWETAMNPETRTLIKVEIEDALITERRVSTLMGDQIELRKEWINKNVVFSLEDNFKIV